VFQFRLHLLHRLRLLLDLLAVDSFQFLVVAQQLLDLLLVPLILRTQFGYLLIQLRDPLLRLIDRIAVDLLAILHIG
jgi:hypothetical protein